MKWNLPIDGPKTLNGLITERLGAIPKKSSSLKINNYLIQILTTSDNTIKKVKVSVEKAKKG